MEEKRLEELRRLFDLRSEKDIAELRKDIEATIALLQAVLSRPDNVIVFLDLDENEERHDAIWGQYQWEEAYAGTGKGHHRVVRDSASYGVDFSYDYAEALAAFLKAVNLRDVSEVELPQVDTNGALIMAVKKRIEHIKGSIEDIHEALARNEAILKELESS